MQIGNLGETIYKINDSDERGEYFIDGQIGRYKTFQEALDKVHEQMLIYLPH